MKNLKVTVLMASFLMSGSAFAFEQIRCVPVENQGFGETLVAYSLFISGDHMSVSVAVDNGEEESYVSFDEVLQPIPTLLITVKTRTDIDEGSARLSIFEVQPVEYFRNHPNAKIPGVVDVSLTEPTLGWGDFAFSGPVTCSYSKN